MSNDGRLRYDTYKRKIESNRTVIEFHTNTDERKNPVDIELWSSSIHYRFEKNNGYRPMRCKKVMDID